ncbi:hypothetical protein FM042_07105 [Aliidiomarina halalkaliphila]|uniref:Solute-binding protein family 3/N-terminal domain-containing protein n=1 Tax=Aliidiomarina halalkaliphila TaxID=2593535 RepID=A0A552X195_9GAMM|nr:hypothetical protein [Aliidiomarina halalkaliphila]TRW48745.1 hypothetical protein FM042_07105 [Aliidiomarina halalkaliphila]
MKHTIANGFIAGLCSLLIAMSAGSTHASEREIVIGTLSDVDSSHPTFQLVQEAYRRIGVSTRLLSLPYERSEYEANRGRIVDAELARTSEAETLFPNLVKIDVPLQPVTVTVFTSNPNLVVNSYRDLQNLRIDTVRGMQVVVSRLGDLPFTEVATIEQTFKRLESGRSDVAVLPGDVASTVLERMDIRGIYKLSPNLEELLLYHWLHQQHADLAEPLANALREVIQERDAQQRLSKSNKP